MAEFGIDLGPLWAQLGTVNNLIILIGAGCLGEAFKRGPITKTFAASKTGQILEYYAPFGLCWLALFLPIGLSAPGATIGGKIMLGLILGALTDSAHDWIVKAAMRFFQKAPDPAPPPLSLPGDRP